MQAINPDDLADMNALAGREPVRVDLVYADAGHKENIFGQALYGSAARLWLHKLFAPVVLKAAALMLERHGAVLILKDGLRPVEAQEAMQQTAIVRANPHWSEGPNRLLSKPGQGGHPRGMAVDAVPVDAATGTPWDMGTVFDHLTTDPAVNPAARAYRHFAAEVLENRRKLEQAFVDAAASLDLPLLPLPSEWWDFRFPASFSETFTPVYDKDLPAAMRVVS
jgi:D-alanyl-D-alanine dipeptidase